ncbi:N-acetylmuramic acid 6-phosphate etherase [Saliniradius amylolyticus]|uniref:N-acetylmuramic acid 6-phosphate etherase n=1 Tax=Saliniradius amylolyticus TaxID=2183582 RepID=A0A2S2E631_9ALTE|nr:N-acetylmuramic acid 6-phosphate etherase [Saliniradius amylolyticus]AWL13108.1 N-acetylmuramic acid 6-phosphate etherase [Saliniradius amylolyticus]
MTQSTTDSHQRQSQLIKQLDTMVSEGRNPETMDIDTLPTLEVLKRLNDEDQKVAPAVRQVLPQIAQAVEKVIAAFADGGRLIYIGAGTSGRLGILDAVECPPTFSVSDQLVQGIIAGGDNAIYKAVEGAEDDPELAVDDLQEAGLNRKDVLVGLAASGRTPYVIAALKYAKSLGATAVGVTCNPGSPVTEEAQIPICVAVGPEALTGSTRLKSGSAQKMVLNMLSTAAMIGSGKSYQNLMVDVNASNEKLYARAIRIVMQATDCAEQEARQALIDCDYKAKLAILHILTGADKAASEALLSQHRGFLRKAVQAHGGEA